jgi:hypothetical protein
MFIQSAPALELFGSVGWNALPIKMSELFTLFKIISQSLLSGWIRGCCSLEKLLLRYFPLQNVGRINSLYSENFRQEKNAYEINHRSH